MHLNAAARTNKASLYSHAHSGSETFISRTQHTTKPRNKHANPHKRSILAVSAHIHTAFFLPLPEPSRVHPQFSPLQPFPSSLRHNHTFDDRHISQPLTGRRTLRHAVSKSPPTHVTLSLLEIFTGKLTSLDRTTLMYIQTPIHLMTFLLYRAQIAEVFCM